MAKITTQDHAANIRALSKVLDSAVRVPGTNVRLGLDALLGLVPGLGDLTGAAFSTYIVLAASRLGAPNAVLLRMLMNLGIDALVGSVPFFGDLFDIAWRSNLKNVQLLEQHLEAPVQARRASRGIVALVLAGLALMAIGAVAVSFLAIRALVGLFR